MVICLVLAILIANIGEASIHNRVAMITEGGLFVINPGESVELDCLFFSAGYDLFSYPVLWVKTQGNESMPINVMSNINDPFLATNRYSVEYVDQNQPRYTLRLFINKAQLEDSGRYNCQVRAPNSTILASVNHTVAVRDPVQHVLVTDTDNTSAITSRTLSPSQLQFVDEYGGDEMNIEMSSKFHLRCLAFGGNPAPNMQIAIGRTQETLKYQYSNKLTLLGEDKGLRRMQYTSQLYRSDYRMKRGENGKRLKCTVTVPGLDPVSEAVRVSVVYKPVIHCTSPEVNIGDQSAFIACKIKANPPKLDVVTWLIDDHKGLSIRFGEVFDEYWMQIITDSEDSNNSGPTEIRLYIREIRREHFKTYALIAQNKIGASSVEMAIKEKAKKITQKQPYKHSDQQSQSEKSSNEKSRHQYRTNFFSSAQKLNTNFITTCLVSLSAYWTFSNFLHREWLST